MKSTYAVLWCSGAEVESGRLEPRTGGFALHGRRTALSIRFADVTAAAIARSHADRLHGLPVLALLLHGGARVRIASLEGVGVLHELAELVLAA